MPWLGLSFAKRSVAKAVASVTGRKQTQQTEDSSASAATTAAEDEFDEDTSGAQPSVVRQLSTAEIEKLKNENEQLKQLIKQMSTKEQAKDVAQSLYPSLSSSSSAPPPATNPSAASSSSSSLSFHRIRPDVSSSSSSSSPPLPSASSSLSSAELAPVSTFYDSLRQSLLASTAPTAPTAAANTAAASSSSSSSALDDDDWGCDSNTSSPERATRSAASAAVDSVHAPRSEDEAIVHNKFGSVVVHKKPLARQTDEEDDATNKPSSSTAANKSFDSFADDEEEEDEFGMVDEKHDRGSSSADSTDDPCEEIAIFDVAHADWWLVVNHPSRADEGLVSAPAPPLDPSEDEDGFIVIKNKDSMAALGEFLSQLMAQNPAVAKLSPEQLRQMLEESLVNSGLKEPSSFGKVWKLGRNVYTIYGWTSTAWSLYTDQTMLRIAAATVIKAATWTVVLLV